MAISLGSSLGRPATALPEAPAQPAKRGQFEPRAATEAAALQVEGLSVRLGGRQVLEGVSFCVGAGELVALIGANGAGKTTLLRAVLGLQAVSAGEVLLGGAPRGTSDFPVGYVPQKVLFDPELPVRVRDLVALGLPGRFGWGGAFGLRLRSRSEHGRGRRASKRLVDELLASVGATASANERVGALSGGEQQRALIAHALARRPRLLLLDEPLANLDLAATQGTVSLLSQIAREQRVAVLVSTHDLNPLLPVLDKVVYLAAGRAVTGPVEQVIRSDVLSALYGQHVDVFHAHGRVIVSAGQAGELGPGTQCAGEDCGPG
jgi:zinc/manganese transport system ATP-binding protein